MAYQALISDQVLGENIRSFISRAFGKEASPSVDLTSAIESFLKSARYFFDKSTAVQGRITLDFDLEQAADCLISVIQQQVSVRFHGEVINVWQLAGVGRSELRISALIAWLLSPNASHGCGERFLLQIIKAANMHFPDKLSEEGLKGASVRTEQFPLIDPDNRVDIEIIGSSFVLFIEVKVDAREGTNQLDRYLKAIEGKALSLGKSEYGMIYLCSRKPSMVSDRLAPLTWSMLRKIIVSEADSIDKDHLILRHLLLNLVSHIDF